MLNKSDVSQIKKVVKEEVRPLKHDVKVVKADIKTVKSDVTKIRRDTNAIVDFFDRKYLDLRKRATRIEEHLGLPPI